MDSVARLYLKRAEDEFLMAGNDMRISTEIGIKDMLGVPREKTFFSSVITHAYYAIFYCAKAYLLSKGIRTRPPEEHRKTYEAFVSFVEGGVLDSELLSIYEDAMLKAETLLEIFFEEKRKRGRFTYNIKSEANLPYARESISNAKKFVSSMKSIMEKGDNPWQ
ncbi:MAG: HEPN domain-containing protein [Candidatus Aenigmarchaeota archaeon]|nr:HEPN domain-containing protein [Candidatus Aenigmarchaeota archaeon]